MSQSGLFAFLATQPLLAMTMLAVLTGTLGWRLQGSAPRAATAMRNTAYLAMVAALLIVVAQLTFRASGSDAALIMTPRPEASVAGSETVLPLQRDGHFWVKAMINGRAQELMVDTGASYVSLTRSAAEAAGIAPLPGEPPLQMTTASGTMTARLGKADTIAFGSIIAHDVEVVIAPDDAGDINVIGMNLLSRLKSWRVEGKELWLTPAIAAPR